MIVKLSTTLAWPIERQIPRRFGAGAGVRFVINEPVQSCDAWIVYQGLPRPDSALCPPENVILFTYEPPGLHRYRPAFLEQFARVVTCHPEIDHPGVVRRHQAQPWLAGVSRDPIANLHHSATARLDIADLESMHPPPKDRAISLLCSSKSLTPGHRARLRFVEALTAGLGDGIDLFGYGYRSVQDKWEALERYRYHVVLENSALDDYWTEKLADAYLGFCLPIVAGCTNLTRYFDRDSFEPIDIADPEASIDRIRALLEADPYVNRLPAIEHARRRVLGEYNLFEEIVRLVLPVPEDRREPITLSDERLFLPGAWVRRRLRPAVDGVRRWRMGGGKW